MPRDRLARGRQAQRAGTPPSCAPSDRPPAPADVPTCACASQEKARLAKEAEEAAARELREREEAERQRKLRAENATYKPRPPSAPYDEALREAAAQVGHWLAQLQGEDIERDLFDALADGVVRGLHAWCTRRLPERSLASRRPCAARR